MKYILEKRIDGEWYEEGRYFPSELSSMTRRAFELGHYDFISDVKISIYYDSSFGKEMI